MMTFIPTATRRRFSGGLAALGLTGALRAAPQSRIDSIRVTSHQPGFYHAWPTLARRKNGDLIAAYSGGREGHVCPFGRVEYVKSTDAGRTWSWPQVVMDSPIDDRDAGILETSRGTLLITTFTSLAYERYWGEMGEWATERVERWKSVNRATTQAERQRLVGAWMLRSTDGGLTWSAPYRVPVTSPHGPVALADGRLLYAGREYPGQQQPGGNRIGVCESKDDGVSWRWLADIPARPGDSVDNYHELHAVETESGRLIAHIRNHNRTNERETLQSESGDGGRTWSAPRAIGVWGLPSHLLKLRDGRLLMSYGYRRTPRGNHARWSANEGRTWSDPMVLSDDGSGDLGYPSTVQLDSGDLATLWYESKRPGTMAVKLPEPPLAVLRLAHWKLT